MTKPGSITRRSFSRMAGMAALSVRTVWLSAANRSRSSIESNGSGFAFLGAFGERQGIHVYAVSGDQWRFLQFAPSDAPVSMALHRNGRWLYVLNGVSEFGGLPCGSVEAFNFDAQSGLLTPLGHQALSLSATLPSSIAVAPDGENLLVAVHGGGAYNLLPILPDGRAGHVTSVIKETGCGSVPGHQDSAHPQSVAFDTTGKRCIATDLGADRITTFLVNNGLTIQSRFDLPAGSGPSHLALHPNGKLVYVANALEDSLSGFRYDSETGTITGHIVQIDGAGGQALAMHPTGRFLYTAGSGRVAAWRIDSSSGVLHRVQPGCIQMNQSGVVHEMAVDLSGRSLIVLADQETTTFEIDPDSGRLSSSFLLASLRGADRIRSIALIQSCFDRVY